MQYTSKVRPASLDISKTSQALRPKDTEPDPHDAMQPPREIIPFHVARSDRPKPEPVSRFHSYFKVGGLAIHAVGERWHARDADKLPFATYPIPDFPGQRYSISLKSEWAEATPISSVEYDHIRRRTAVNVFAQSQDEADEVRDKPDAAIKAWSTRGR